MPKSPILCLVLFLFGMSIQANAQSVEGKWYGIGRVQMEDESHNYMTEMILKQDGNQVKGEFSYYFKDRQKSIMIEGGFDKNTRILILKGLPIIFYKTNDTQNAVESVMTGRFELRVSKTASILNGILYSKPEFQYVVPEIKYRFLRSIQEPIDTAVSEEEQDFLTLDEIFENKAIPSSKIDSAALVKEKIKVKIDNAKIEQAKIEALKGTALAKTKVPKQVVAKEAVVNINDNAVSGNNKNAVVDSKNNAVSAHNKNAVVDSNNNTVPAINKNSVAANNKNAVVANIKNENQISNINPINALVTTATLSNKNQTEQTLPIKDTIPIIDTRQKSYIREIVLDNDHIRVDLYDNGTIDYDSVSLYLNGKEVLAKTMLNHRSIKVNLQLDPTIEFNELSMFAENLGMISPNTAAMIVRDGQKEYQLLLQSDFSKSATLKLKVKKPKP